MASDDDAKALVASLDMKPHPEGGYYVETFRAADDAAGTSAVSLIYYLLEAGQSSHWHRVSRGTEIWHYYAGGPLELRISADGVETQRHVLGVDFPAGQVAHAVVTPNAWQAAKPLGAFTLVGCTVSPAFSFDNFFMAPPGWEPGPDGPPPAPDASGDGGSGSAVGK